MPNQFGAQFGNKNKVMLVLTIFVLGEAQHVMWMGNKYYIFLIIILFLLKKTFKSLLKQNIIGIMCTLASDILSLCVIKDNLNLIVF